MEETRLTVAVVGLGTSRRRCSARSHQLIIAGVLGLVALKNLVEEGFDVTGFDSNAYVGGLWHYTDEDKTSVLPSALTRNPFVGRILTQSSYCHQHF